MMTKRPSKEMSAKPESYLPLHRDPFTEFITSRLGIAISILAIALCCDHFVAKPVLQQRGLTEVQLFNEIMEKTGVITNFENTLRFIHETIPTVTGVAEPENRPGHILASQGARAKYPVVLVPGFITSGLDLWASEDCAKKHVRQKIWGSLSVFLQTFVTDTSCYVQHLALDPLTGGDPQNIKVRSSTGFDATDYFFNVIWVWEKLVANLADVGYDSTNMMMMPYDWRLSFKMLEERDGYLTQLKMNIEFLRKTTGEPVVLTAHSMGSQVVLYFFKWVTTDEEDGGGGGGDDWLENNVKDFINISGPLLGVPKSATALLSGEMKDFASLAGAGKIMMERFLSRKTRKETWSTWGALWEMLPKGGDAIWETPHEYPSTPICEDALSPLGVENEVCTVNNEAEHKHNSASFITFTEEVSMGESESTHKLANEEGGKIVEKGWTVDETVAFIKSQGDSLHGSKNMASWSDPLVTPLPSAPSMKIYCLYGFGIPTERSYFYRKTKLSNPEHESGSNDKGPFTDSLPFVMDSSVHSPDENIIFGSQTVDGDVSVPLISLGYLCADKWRTSNVLNPSGIDIITREYKHREGPKPRGPHSSEHVDILGNVDTTTDILQIVTGFSETLDDRILSDIEYISQKISSNSSDGKVTR